MTNLSSGSLVLRAASWPSRHSRAVAFSWGVFSGYTFGPMLLGAAAIGYLVGKSGGVANLAISSLGMLAGFAITMSLLVGSVVNSDCPSCVYAATFLAPAVFGTLLIPLALGFWVSRRSSRRAAGRAATQGVELASVERVDAVPTHWREAGWLSGALSVPSAFVIAFVSVRAGIPRASDVIYLLTAIVIVRMIGTRIGLHGRRDWILACAYCVGFGVLVATFLLQIWAFAGCPVFAQHC